MHRGLSVSKKIIYSNPHPFLSVTLPWTLDMNASAFSVSKTLDVVHPSKHHSFCMCRFLVVSRNQRVLHTTNNNSLFAQSTTLVLEETHREDNKVRGRTTGVM